GATVRTSQRAGLIWAALLPTTDPCTSSVPFSTGCAGEPRASAARTLVRSGLARRPAPAPRGRRGARRARPRGRRRPLAAPEADVRRDRAGLPERPEPDLGADGHPRPRRVPARR